MPYQGNIGLLFTKLYFKTRGNEEINYNRDDTVTFPSGHFKLRNEELLSAQLSNTKSVGLKPFFGDNHNYFKHFNLTTVYPGLLTGSGYMHDVKNDNAFKLGFYFDHTTGLPVIPGSSVKGVLRSAFEKANGNYIKYILENELNLNRQLNITKLKEHIFEGKGYIEKNGKKIWDYLPMHQRDVFLDAFPVKVKNKLLGNDYITPHKDKDGNYNPLKNPNPIQFLKVMPGVTFRFEFILRDFRDENGNTLITADNKRDLFKAILQDLGIGAKTNVGYGQFK